MNSPVLAIGPRIQALPIVHGSGDCAVEVRRVMLSSDFDCLAVPLPPSFQSDVERAIEFLPSITAVVQHETSPFDIGEWSPESDGEEASSRAASFVPIDPCQPVIAALRIALQERIPRAFIDRETRRYEEPTGTVLPDPYALRKVSLERFAAAVLPSLPRPAADQLRSRVASMAHRLRELESRYRSILFVCSVTDWPWIREAYMETRRPPASDDDVEETAIHAVAGETLAFLLGELPFITGLYERARAELDDDENLSVDGIKELVLVARDRYREELGQRARRITPKMLATYFRYVRNLALIERRMTPDLYTLVVAAQQIAGDEFAIRLAETAREYPYDARVPFPTLRMGIGRAAMPDGEILRMKNRLPGHPVVWRTCRLQPRPPKPRVADWQMQWNPFNQCSWPPEDVAIERFRNHVKDVALELLGDDLARTEKFTTSLKDGLDIRETLRNWHTGDLYVKIHPPSRGRVDCVLMFFDSPADPRRYPWRITWHAEHDEESTLAMYATDFKQDLVGPGIGRAIYGGAMFLFPPRGIPDIWQDRRFDFADTLEERLLAAGCYYAEERHIAVLSEVPPGAGWRRLARRFGKKLIPIPLSRFSQETIERLRVVHVLNGRHVRSYADLFIRRG